MLRSNRCRRLSTRHAVSNMAPIRIVERSRRTGTAAGGLHQRRRQAVGLVCDSRLRPVVLGRTRGRPWAGEREAFRRAELRHKETSELLRASPPLGLIPGASGPVGLRRLGHRAHPSGKPGDPTRHCSAEWKPLSLSCADPHGSVHIRTSTEVLPRSDVLSGSATVSGCSVWPLPSGLIPRPRSFAASQGALCPLVAVSSCGAS